MVLAYIFTVGCSLVVLFAIFIQAKKNQNVAGSKAFLWQIVFVSVWAVCSLMEMLSPTDEVMLFWRNIEQIGIFLLPVSCVYFSVEYAQYNKWKKYLKLFVIIPFVALVLIFTDSATHIMRYGYVISDSPLFGKALSVHSTPVGSAFVAYNFILAFISLVILFVFSKQIGRSMRRQVIYVLIAMSLIFLFGLLKTAFLEGTSVNIPIVVLYLPGSLILFYNLYRNNFFYVSPIARDKVFDVIDYGILVTDSAGTIVDKNPFAVSLLNSFFEISEELVGKKLNEVFREYPKWPELAENNTAGELEVEKSSGSPHFIQFSAYPLQSVKGTTVGLVTIIRDITAARLQEFELMKKAERDSLSALLNRHSFMGAFEKILAESAGTEEPVSVLMMDLDKFKEINDSFGHDIGDRVIIALSDLLKGALRQKDAIGRIGGDEFAAILPGVSRNEAKVIADRILKTTNERFVFLEDGTYVCFTLSIGICDNKDTKLADDMLKYADKAMYLAKNKMRNSCIVWN
jgi:diguanylate cyclase